MSLRTRIREIWAFNPMQSPEWLAFKAKEAASADLWNLPGSPVGDSLFTLDSEINAGGEQQLPDLPIGVSGTEPTETGLAPAATKRGLFDLVGPSVVDASPHESPSVVGAPEPTDADAASEGATP